MTDDWESLPITEAAGKAGWQLTEASGQNGLLARYVQWIGDRLPFG